MVQISKNKWNTNRIHRFFPVAVKKKNREKMILKKSLLLKINTYITACNNNNNDNDNN